jgi:hypothetical protein
VKDAQNRKRFLMSFEVAKPNDDQETLAVSRSFSAFK